MGALYETAVDSSEFQALLMRARRHGAKLQPIMDVVAEGLVADVSDQFESEGMGKWAPLAAATLAARRKRGRGAKILQDTGRFAGSIRAHAGPNFAEATTDVAYAVYHVSDAPRSRIPLRNPFDLPDEAFDRHVDTIRQYLAEGLLQ